MRVHLTLKSGNAKTGPIPVSTTESASCPDSCPLKSGQGCYADGGPLAIHWRAVSAGKRGDPWGEFCSKISALPDGQVWRHNQAGDLPHKSGKVAIGKVRQLVRANRGKRGFTYSHHAPTRHNLALFEECNREGFAVNLSANNLVHADLLARESLGTSPIVSLIPEGFPTKGGKTPEGRPVVPCPAQTHPGVTCESCKLCAQPDRIPIIGFYPHGSSARKAEKVARFQV